VPDERDTARATLLCLSQSFPPETTPTAIRAGKLLERLSRRWEIEVVTESAGPGSRCGARVHVVAGRRPRRLLRALQRARLGKLIDAIVWPDDSIFWLVPAILAARRAIRARRPQALVVFMMPYSSGLAGLLLARLHRLPLLLNLDDSPTCTDMHPSFPSRLHFRLARALEDRYARRADAIVYVSQRNLADVRARARSEDRERFHLVRYGGDAPAQQVRERGSDFEIAYVGAMSGWWALIGEAKTGSLATRAYRAFNELGRFERTALDERTSSPAVLGRAIAEASAAHPEWRGRIGLTIHGNPYPPDVVERALDSAGVREVVSVKGPIEHERVGAIMAGADLLFLTLPARPDGSPGGRISAKTYEYLSTDRPILAAVPRGESWDYLSDKPGVWLVEPDDREGMAEALVELAGAKFAGAPLSFDREQLRREISYDARAAQFADAIESAVAAAAARRGARARARGGR
jgi:glycosyltransferase involved in cell wall biosynthesis